jgi:hypothetical protein
MPVILATQEAKELKVQGQAEQFRENLSQNKI